MKPINIDDIPLDDMSFIELVNFRAGLDVARKCGPLEFFDKEGWKEYIIRLNEIIEVTNTEIQRRVIGDTKLKVDNK